MDGWMDGGSERNVSMAGRKLREMEQAKRERNLCLQRKEPKRTKEKVKQEKGHSDRQRRTDRNKTEGHASKETHGKETKRNRTLTDFVSEAEGWTGR